MPSGQGAGTNPIHNKKPKKKQEDPDSDEEARRQQRKEDEKKRKEMANSIAGKKGPLNTGGQGIKKSGKK